MHLQQHRYQTLAAEELNLVVKRQNRDSSLTFGAHKAPADVYRLVVWSGLKWLKVVRTKDVEAG